MPEGETVERVEIFLNETRVATLYQPPFSQPVVLPKDEQIAYVRAVAYLTDGNSTEDLVFVNAPDNLEEMEVQFVELYTSVLDRSRAGRWRGCSRRTSRSVEDGVRQEIARFEQVTEPADPCRRGPGRLGLDEDKLEQARQAALRFFEQTIQPKDRAALITFNDRPTPGGEVHQRRHRARRRPRGPQGRARHRALRLASSSRSTTSTASRASGPCCCSPTARTRAAASPTRTRSTTPAGPA